MAGAEQARVIEREAERETEPPLIEVPRPDPRTNPASLAEALLEVASGVNQGLARHEVFERIAIQLGRMMPLTGLMICRTDPSARIATPVFVRAVGEEKAAALRTFRFRYGEGLTGRCAETGEPVVMNEDEHDDPTLAPLAVPGCPDDEQQFIMVVPLRGPDGVEGTLTIYRDGPGQHRWRAEDVHLASLFATQAQVAFRNAELYAKVEERAKRLQAMNEILRPVSASLDLHEICRVYEVALAELLPFTVGGICVRRRAGRLVPVWLTDNVRWRSGAPIPQGHGPWWVAEHGRGYFVDDLHADHPFGPHPAFQVAGAVAYVSAPLKARGRTFGVIGLGHEQRGFYSKRCLATLEELAVYLAATLDNALLYEEVRSAKKDQGELLARLITAQEEERKALAADLHDDTIQSLAAGLMLVDRITLTDQRERRLELTGKLRHTLQTSMERARKLMVDLRPPVLDNEGLVPALEQQLQPLRDEDGMVIEFDSELAERPQPTVETLLFRSLQEALQNIRKHAKASRVAVKLCRGPEDGWITVSITDDGVGFDPPAVLPQAIAGGHLGLHSLLQRVELAGGRTDITASPNAGTRLVISVPSTLGGTD